MIPQLLALMLALTASPEAATATATATPTTTRSLALTLPASSAGLGPVALPALLLAALAIAAALLTRKKRLLPRRIRILETASLGPRRALVLARLGDEVLLLGSSEAGVALLRTLPADPAGAPLDSAALRAATLGANGSSVPAPARPGPTPAAEPPSPLAALAARLGVARSRPAAPPPAFDALLAESAEDQELRRKLALGRPGSVR